MEGINTICFLPKTKRGKICCVMQVTKTEGWTTSRLSSPLFLLHPSATSLSEVTGGLGAPDARFRGPSQSIWNTIPNKRTGIFIGPSVSLRLTYQGPSLKHQGFMTSLTILIVIRYRSNVKVNYSELPPGRGCCGEGCVGYTAGVGISGVE